MSVGAPTLTFSQLPRPAQLRVLVASVLGVAIVLVLAGSLFSAAVVALRELVEEIARVSGIGVFRTWRILTLAASVPVGLMIFQLAFVVYLRWFVHHPVGACLPRYYRMSRGRVQRARLKLTSRMALRAAGVCLLFGTLTPIYSTLGIAALSVAIGAWLVLAPAGSEEILYQDLRPLSDEAPNGGAETVAL